MLLMLSAALRDPGVQKFAPKLLPTFDFLYGPNATGSCLNYGTGGLRPLGSRLMTDGVAQTDGFGPIFVSLRLEQKTPNGGT